MSAIPSTVSQAVPDQGDRQLVVLTEIAQILSSTLDLRQGFGRIMQIISESLQMHRGTLVLLDDSTGRLRTETAYGLSAEDIERNRFALGEGITGNVVATGTGAPSIQTGQATVRVMRPDGKGRSCTSCRCAAC